MKKLFRSPSSGALGTPPMGRRRKWKRRKRIRQICPTREREKAYMVVLTLEPLPLLRLLLIIRLLPPAIPHSNVC